MIHLIEKEFRINPRILSLKKDKILSSLLSVFLLLIIIGISTFMFILLFDKFNTYNAALPFAMIYFFCLSVISMIIAILKTRSTFFNTLDFTITVSRPIETFMMIMAKAFYLFLVLFFLELFLFGPHYFAFGIQADRLPSYYYMVILSIMFHTIFDLAVALILVSGVELLYRFLKKHLVLQISLIVIVVIVLTLLYSTILNLFLNLLNKNAMAYLFNDKNIALLRSVALYLYPDVYISGSLLTINYGRIFSYILIASGSLILGIIVLYLLYPRIIAVPQDKNRIYKDKPRVFKKPHFAFLKKEVLLLMRESDNLYNFTGLVLISPVLSFLVLRGLNEAFTNGFFAIYSAILPNFMNSVTILIILLFSSLVSLSSAGLMKSESKSIRIVKYLPYPITKQVYIKMGILGLATLFTNLLALLLLLLFREISIGMFIFLIIATTFLNATLIVLSFRSEILNFRKPNNENALASFLALIIPVVLAGGNMLLSFATDLVQPVLLYLINIAVLLIFLGFTAFYLWRYFQRDLTNLEVIN